VSSWSLLVGRSNNAVVMAGHCSSGWAIDALGGGLSVSLLASCSKLFRYEPSSLECRLVIVCPLHRTLRQFDLLAWDLLIRNQA
jgi:hypothetical protein